MATISEYLKTFPKEAWKLGIYQALGKDLTEELNQAGCELHIHDDLKTYHFTNLTEELQTKIDLKKISNL
jgi:hypothetical protein